LAPLLPIAIKIAIEKQVKIQPCVLCRVRPENKKPGVFAVKSAQSTKIKK